MAVRENNQQGEKIKILQKADADEIAFTLTLPPHEQYIAPPLCNVHSVVRSERSKVRYSYFLAKQFIPSQSLACSSLSTLFESDSYCAT
tara:strand:- start:23 stop:289 length:267 start_codon:yes stop_codon:yes gene_type:complete